jgi:hypothetical protein
VDGKPTGGLVHFPDGTRTDRVRPRANLTNDETLQRLHEVPRPRPPALPISARPLRPPCAI